MSAEDDLKWMKFAIDAAKQGASEGGVPIGACLVADGKVVTNAHLDVCHGTVSKVWFNGKYQSIYHYVLNNEYPYSVGCFRGTPAELPLYIAFGSMTTSSSPSASSTTTTTTMAGM